MLGSLQWQSHLKIGSPRFRFKRHLSAMAANNPVNGVQSYSSALADVLGREEWLKEMRFHHVGNTGSTVDNLNETEIELSGSSNYQITLTAHGIDRIVNEIGPDLVQLASARKY